MDTINTTTPPLIMNNFGGFFDFDFINIRLEPTEPEFFRGFKIDDDIVLVFEEQVTSGSGDIVISSETDTRHINIEDANQVSFDIMRSFLSSHVAGRELQTEHLELSALIINPEMDLLPDTTYTIQIDDGALVDTVGNALAGFNNIEVSAIDSAPNLRSFGAFPTYDGSRDFKADGNLFLSFDEAVIAGTGEIIISSDMDTRTIDINDTSQVTFDDNGKVTINPQEDLIPNTFYTLQVPDGAVADIEDNIFTNFNPTIFTTVAGSLPQLALSRPENGSSEFEVNRNIELRFDEVVKAGTGNIVISSDSDVRTIAINDTSQVTFDNDFVIINPTDDLMPDVSYTVQIADGVITDLSGNAYSGFDNGSLSTIEEIQRPTFSGTIRDGGISTFKADENIVVSPHFLDKAIAGSGDIIISNGSDIRTIAIDDTSQVTFETDGIVTIDPKEDLIPDTTYTVQIPSSAIIDTKDSNFAGINEAFLTTIDSGPIVLSVAPISFKTFKADFKADDGIVLTFDELVIAGEGNIVISNGVDVRTIAIDDGSQVTFLGRSVVIDPKDDLAPGQYTGSISSGAITDRAGNTFAGISDASFTVTSDAAPILTSSNPNNGDTDFRIDENIRLSFDEVVAAGSANIIISNGTDTRAIAINDTSQVTFEEFNFSNLFGPPITEGTVIINPTEDLVPGTTYTVEIAPGVIIDTDGNPYAGFSDASFTTIDSLPVVTIGGNETDATVG